MKKQTWAVVLLTLVALVLGGLTVISAPTTKKQPEQAKTAAAPSPVKPTSVKILIPGEAPFDALHEDYNTPSSLWVLVSKAHPLADPNYVPANLSVPDVKTRSDKSVAEQSLRSDIEPSVKNLFSAASTAGHDIMLASGFRSYALQQTYFSNYSRLYGEESANKFSAKPGQSEHQTGLAFDISLSSRVCYLEICFGDTEAGKWLAAHSYEYGFILRYPADKTAITQYQYEPWHFRYVGYDLASALHKNNLTLDEAYPYLQTALSELNKTNTAP
ncbi:M15 family metallopeptidase [Candidatus Saccharibacteria bacterium]|nr:MAG: M15 family metallopeptidase [Candidatus Saccharibacteria bacterium]